MKLIARMSAALAVALAVAVGGAGTAVAKHGFDDPAGHHQGEHHHHGMHHHHKGEHHHGQGADDGPNHK
jgi:hypothetical protein